MGIGRAVLLLSILLVVAGCSGGEPDSLDPLPKVTHPPAQVPKDRDLPAVLSALRQLDACALLDPAAAGYPANVKPASYGPHKCLISDGNNAVSVSIGVPFDHTGRFESEVLTVAGAKAYRRLPKDRSACEVSLPVSFQLAITFQAERDIRRGVGGGDYCVQAKGFAEYAATRLADPDRVRPGQSMPMAEWDACQLLTAALGDNPAGYRLSIDEGGLGVDGCHGKAENPAKADTRDLELGLKLSYGADPVRFRDSVRVIGGKPTYVYEFPLDDCTLTWSNGKVTSTVLGNTDQVVELKAPGCPAAEAIATAMMAKLAAGAGALAAAQRPITYRPDEPDEALAGACVHVGGLDDPRKCQPYVDVPVPSGRAPVIRAAEADPNIMCAISRDAVAQQFGAGFTPVTVGNTCLFVEPNHAVRIEVEVSADKEPSDGEGVTVAGRRGVRRTVEQSADAHRRFSVWAGMESRSGMVSMTVDLHLPRGSDGKSRVDGSMLDKLEPVLTDVLTKHFD